VEIDEFGEDTVLVSVRVYRSDQWTRLTFVGRRFIGLFVIGWDVSS
jgi:hypothetical protein